MIDAQFSMPFGAAIAITYGQASLDEYTEDMLGRSDIKDLMNRVECVQDPALEVNYPSQWPAWVEVETRDGRTLKSQIEYPKGDPENALSWDELKDKFRNLTQPVISPSRQEEIINAVDSLEALDDVRVLARMTSA